MESISHITIRTAINTINNNYSAKNPSRNAWVFYFAAELILAIPDRFHANHYQIVNGVDL